VSATLGELAARLGRPLEGDASRRVRGAAGLDEAGPEELSFARGEANAEALRRSKAGALVAPPGLDCGGRPVIRSPFASLDFARATALLHPAPRPPAGVHPTAFVAPDASVDPTAAIGPLACVGARARVGARSVLHAGAMVLDDVRVGADCVLHARSVVREGCELGDRVVLQPGAVIGGDGFGYEFNERGEHEKVPQIGVVVLEDDVEVGANSTIDRARLGATRIGRGVKIDNLVQVAHNVQIGAHSALVAQSGIAGSTKLGERVFFMAQSGASGQLTIGDGVFVGARGGVIEDLPAHTRWWGFPQQPERAWHRVSSALAKLPDLLRRVRRLEKKLGVGGEGQE
jgi:UDP-3-O-[3-hydroxymyristoyl] glucosamine N-acyltransferase